MEPEEQGVVAPQDPAVVVPDPAPEPVPVPEPTGPWADQLAQFDEALRPQVDGFLREHIQPYTTRLEQQLAEAPPEEAAKLWADINDPEKAAATYLALTGELFEDNELTDLIKDTIQQHYAEPDAVTPGEPELPAETQRDPEVQALLDERAETKYKSDVDAALEANKIPAEWQPLIHAMIVSADGDIPAAGAALAKQLTDAGAIAAEPQPDPPPPVGDPTPAAVPVAKDYGGDMGAAIDDFFDSQAIATPPPVGGV